MEPTTLTTLPNTLSVTQAAQLANLLASTVSIGPLTIEYKIDMSIPRVMIDTRLFGISIGHAVIDRQNPTALLGGNIGFAAATISLTADLDGKRLLYSIDVEKLGTDLLRKDGTLVTW